MESEPQIEREIVRRFDSNENVKQAKKHGIDFDQSKGNGIPTSTTHIEPVDPDSIRVATGARSAEAFIDIDITGKQVVRRTTKAGHKEILVQENVGPEDIVGSGRVRKTAKSPGD